MTFTHHGNDINKVIFLQCVKHGQGRQFKNGQFLTGHTTTPNLTKYRTAVTARSQKCDHFYLIHILSCIRTDSFWEQGCRSGESTRLPPMWSGFESRTQRHMWVEFVVGSHPCSGAPVFLPPQKPTLLNSNSIWDPRATGLSVARLLSVTLVKQSQFIYLFIYPIRSRG